MEDNFIFSLIYLYNKLPSDYVINCYNSYYDNIDCLIYVLDEALDKVLCEENNVIEELNYDL